MLHSLIMAASLVAPADHIVWFTTLNDALAEAARTNRPILLQSAAPACQGVPGIW